MQRLRCPLLAVTLSPAVALACSGEGAAELIGFNEKLAGGLWLTAVALTIAFGVWALRIRRPKLLTLPSLLVVISATFLIFLGGARAGDCGTTAVLGSGIAAIVTGAYVAGILVFTRIRRAARPPGVDDPRA